MLCCKRRGFSTEGLLLVLLLFGNIGVRVFLLPVPLEAHKHQGFFLGDEDAIHRVSEHVWCPSSFLTLKKTKNQTTLLPSLKQAGSELQWLLSSCGHVATLLS